MSVKGYSDAYYSEYLGGALESLPVWARPANQAPINCKERTLLAESMQSCERHFFETKITGLARYVLNTVAAS